MNPTASSPLHTVLARSAGLALLLSVSGALSMAVPTSAHADETITFYDSAFLPTTATIQQGETVFFVWDEGDHIVTSGESSDPDDNPGELFEFELNEDNPGASYTFNDAGAFAFFDALDEGLVGTIIVEIFEVDVAVLDSEFDPGYVEIFAGEQVHWYFDGDLLHSVTNGVDLEDPDVALLFDATINFPTPDFSYIFDNPGDYPYFCTPHLSMGMTGIVKVQRRFIRGDATNDEIVDISDAITMLKYLFLDGAEPACADSYDVDDSGTLSVGDPLELLNHLFQPGSKAQPASPYPFMGPDRTADSFLCE